MKKMKIIINLLLLFVMLLFINTTSYAYCRLTAVYYHNYGTATNPNVQQVSYSLEDDYTTATSEIRAEVGYPMTFTSQNVKWAAYEDYKSPDAESGGLGPTPIYMHEVQGGHTFCLYGMSSSDYYMKIWIFTEDTIAPTVSISGTSPTTWKKSVTITGKATDIGTGINGYEFYQGAASGYTSCAQNYSSSGATFSKTITSPGTWYFRAKDVAGNSGVSNALTINNIDSVKPASVTLTSNAGSGWKKGSVTLTGTAIDTLSGINGYAFTNSSSVPTSWTAITATTNQITQTKVVNTNGSTNWYFWVKDQAGNTNLSNVCTIKIDNNNPTPGRIIAKIRNASGATYNFGTSSKEDIYIEMVNGSDATTSVTSTYSINGGAAQTKSQVLKDNGTYNIVVTTTDAAGNTAKSSTYTIIIKKIVDGVKIKLNNIIDTGTGVKNLTVFMKLSSESQYGNSIKEIEAPNENEVIIISPYVGTYDIKVVCVDKAGNVGTIIKQNILIE